MTELIKLVQGDTRPQILVIVKDELGAAQSVAGATVRMRFANADTMEVVATVVGDLLAGLEDAQGNINAAPPYDTPGSGGRVVFIWEVGMLDVPEGPYLGEVEVTFADGGVHTVNELIPFYVRSQLG